MELRNYQVAPYQAGFNFFQADSPKPGILVAPTAFGKSVVIGKLAQNIEGNTLVLQPSKELLEQNYKKFIALGGRGSIFSASMNRKNIARATYATIGSIYKVAKQFKDLNFRNLIIDEAHLYPRDVLTAADVHDGVKGSMLATFLYESGINKVLGLTATPFKLQNNVNENGERFSKLQMLTSRSKNGQFFKDIIHVTQIQELTAAGYWSPLTYDKVEFDRSKLEYNSTRADFTEASLHWTFERQSIKTKILERVSGSNRRSIIVFVPTINDAINIARLLPKAAAVHSKLDDDTRERILKDFLSGRIQTVVNVNILSVGFDHPELDYIISARPTASLAWYYQSLGRGTRLAAAKKDCLITDLVGNVERFGRIEDLYFRKKSSWQLYGEGGRLLTGLALDQIGDVRDSDNSDPVISFGKHTGKKVSELPPEYAHWMIREFKFTPSNDHLRVALEKFFPLLKTA